MMFEKRCGLAFRFGGRARIAFYFFILDSKIRLAR